MNRFFTKAAEYFKSLSFRTGAIVAVICAICYAVSFAQMLLPISTTAKGVLWFIFFGLAKTCQYTAILILGKAGVQRLRAALRPRKSTPDNP